MPTQRRTDIMIVEAQARNQKRLEKWMRSFLGRRLKNAKETGDDISETAPAGGAGQRTPADAGVAEAASSPNIQARPA